MFYNYFTLHSLYAIFNQNFVNFADYRKIKKLID